MIGDNASDDGSANFIRQLAARHPDSVVAITRDENVGGVSNINDLLKRGSESDFVLIVADDDRNGAPDRLFRLIEKLDAVPEAAMATGTTIYQDGPDIVDRWCLADDGERTERLRSSETADRVTAMMEVTDPTNNADIFGLIRGEVVEAAGGLSSIRGADSVYLGRLAALGSIVVTPEAYLVREVGGLSTRPDELTAEKWAARATTAREMVADITQALASEPVFDSLGDTRPGVVARITEALTNSLVDLPERRAAGERFETGPARFSEATRLDNPALPRVEQLSPSEGSRRG
jgi:GT2 family glycosyltransferase